MILTRRDLAAAGALALGAASLVRPAIAAATDEALVGQCVEELRKALLTQDKAALAGVTAAELSYGHSTGLIQDKAEFIAGVMTRKAAVKSLEFPELKVILAGDAAITRHLYLAESETAGKANTIRIGVLAVWQKADGSWKLLARQGYKLP
jgi:ketosteroid isomerase-like protein